MKKVKRFFYVFMMMRAIRKAQYDYITEKYTTKTNGLRCIKTFERVNMVKFNPFSSEHVDKISGMGSNEEFFRKVRLLFKSWEKK